MATDATGTVTSPDSIPTYNTAVDAPSGNGFNAAMAAIQTALSNRLAADATTLAATRLVATKLLVSDAQPAFRLLGNGKLEWGAGGASAVDTNLYRNGASELKTDDTLESAAEIYARHGTGTFVALGLLGPGGEAAIQIQDATLYRAAADELRMATGDTLKVSAAGLKFNDNTVQTTAAGAGAYVQLYDNTLGAATAGWDVFSGLGGYNHLKLVVTIRGDAAVSAQQFMIRLNGDLTASYDWQRMYSNTAAMNAAESVGDTKFLGGWYPANTASASTVGSAEILIPNYTDASFQQTLTSTGSATFSTASGGFYTFQYGGQWRATAAITRVQILPETGNFVTGSRLTIYGLL